MQTFAIFSVKNFAEKWGQFFTICADVLYGWPLINMNKVCYLKQ